MSAGKTRPTGLPLSRRNDVAPRALRPLALALTLSVALHCALLFGVRVRSGHAQPPTMGEINARLIVDREEAKQPIAPAAKHVPPSGGDVSPATPSAPNAQPRSVRRSPSVAARLASQTPTDARRSVTHERAAEVSDVTEVTLPLPRDPTWYSARQLDELPRPLRPIRPKHPDAAGEGKATGRIVLRLLIDESGTVTDVSVLEPAREGHFETSALAAVRETRFRPGSKGGRIVKSSILLELSYGAHDAADAL
jgi:protein TonB